MRFDGVFSALTVSPEPESPLPLLAGMLARADTGIGFIYDALDLLAAHYHLSDALLRVDASMTGLQMFRLGRAPVQATMGRKAWLATVAASAQGLTTEPDVVDSVTANNLVDLATVALRLDLLGYDASHDPLTGLLNRRSYEESLHHAVSRSCRYGWPFALVAIDLDEFKLVNDRLGHPAGDEALRTLGTEIRGVLRGGDVAARLGGDEFVLIVHNARHAADVDPLLARLHQTMVGRRPDTGLRFSAGASYFPADASDAATLAKIADIRLYAAKQRIHRQSSDNRAEDRH